MFSVDDKSEISCGCCGAGCMATGWLIEAISVVVVVGAAVDERAALPPPKKSASISAEFDSSCWVLFDVFSASGLVVKIPNGSEEFCCCCSFLVVVIEVVIEESSRSSLLALVVRCLEFKLFKLPPIPLTCCWVLLIFGACLLLR